MQVQWVRRSLVVVMVVLKVFVALLLHLSFPQSSICNNSDFRQGGLASPRMSVTGATT